MHDRTAKAEPSRQNRDEHISVNRKEQHLENRIECHQPRTIIGIAVCQIVPHDHHRDTSCEADHDQPHHVLGTVAQKNNRKREHQDRPDNPVLHQRQRENFHVAENIAQLVVVHLRKRRIHHQDEPKSDRYRRGSDVHPVERRLHPGKDRTDPDTRRHREKNPQRKIAIQKREPAQNRPLRHRHSRAHS